MIKRLSDRLWKHYPAFYAALIFNIGIASGCHLYWIGLIFFFPKRSLWILGLLGLLYFKLLYPQFPEGEREGTALFHIQEVKKHVGPFSSCLVYKGIVKSFHSGKERYHRLPCALYMYNRKNRPLATRDYLIPSATLIEIAPHCYILKAKKGIQWIPILGTHSFAERRFGVKKRVKQTLRKWYGEKRVADLMIALTTGHLENRILAYQFGKLGLQHLLAVSGFHFACLTAFLAFILSRFLPQRGVALSLIALLGGYFFYMGTTPSISRAWIGVFIFLVGMVLHYRPTALNALGVALIAALIANPLVIFNIGFQLSYGATLGILFFYKRFEKGLEKCLPKRPFEELRAMNFMDQCGYLVCAYLRKVVALNGAVLTFTLPLIVFHFQTFPLLSLVYNLFFPLLFTLLFIGMLIPPLNAYYAHFLLDLIEGAPKRLMFELSALDLFYIALAVGLVKSIRWRLLYRDSRS